MFIGIWYIETLYDGFGNAWGNTTKESCHHVFKTIRTAFTNQQYRGLNYQAETGYRYIFLFNLIWEERKTQQ